MLRTKCLVSYIRTTDLFDTQPRIHRMQYNRLSLSLRHVKQLTSVMKSNLCTQVLFAAKRRKIFT